MARPSQRAAKLLRGLEKAREEIFVLTRDVRFIKTVTKVGNGRRQ